MVRFIAEWLWLPPPRYAFFEDDLGLSSHTIVDWSSFCREVCVKWVDDNSSKLGGPGTIVEINEAKFGKSKYNRGRFLKGRWVFGGYERGSKRIFVVSVENRTAETLLRVIEKWILPGTTIMSDCWKAYNCLDQVEYVHLSVNHSYNFVDSDIKTNMQSIERTWSDVRQNNSKYGTREQNLSSYFCEYLFKRCHKKSERINIFFDLVATYKDFAEQLEVEMDPSSSSSEGLSLSKIQETDKLQ